MQPPLPLKLKNVLIVDGYSLSADTLGDRFRTLGATVHIVADSTAATTMVRNKKIDVVFIGYRHGGQAQLRKTLDQHGVPYITCATPKEFSHHAVNIKVARELQAAN